MEDVPFFLSEEDDVSIFVDLSLCTLLMTSAPYRSGVSPFAWLATENFFSDGQVILDPTVPPVFFSFWTPESVVVDGPSLRGMWAWSHSVGLVSFAKDGNRSTTPPLSNFTLTDPRPLRMFLLLLTEVIIKSFPFGIPMGFFDRLLALRLRLPPKKLGKDG